VKTEPTTCCDGQQANQNDQRGEPPVCSGPANSPKPLLGPSKSSNTAGVVGHILVSAQVVRKIKSLVCRFLGAGLASSTKSVIQPVGGNHATTTCHGDGDFMPMRWQPIAVESSREDESQPKHHQRDNRFFVMSAISQDKGHCTEDRYTNSQHSMCMLFRR
jgi:hypothetical protein